MGDLRGGGDGCRLLFGGADEVLFFGGMYRWRSGDAGWIQLSRDVGVLSCLVGRDLLGGISNCVHRSFHL